MKETDLLSELTYIVVVTVSDANITSVNPASLGGDFSLLEGSSQRIMFPPDTQSLKLTLYLNPDNVPEGTEAFQAQIRSERFPTFLLPTSAGIAFPTTTIIIRDNDCEQ